MGKSGGQSADPRVGEAAMKQAETGQQWYEFTRDVYNQTAPQQERINALGEQLAGQQLDAATLQNEQQRQMFQRYNEEYVPLEQQMLEEAKNYDSPEKQAQAAAEARGDVQTSAAGARATAAREAARYGIKPGSGMAGSTSANLELGTALGAANAANTARKSVRDTGINLRIGAANFGRGLPNTALAAGSTANQTSAGALGSASAGLAAQQARTGMVGQGAQGAMSGYQGSAGTLQAQQNGVNASNQANSSGTGALVGTALTAAAIYF